MDGQAVPDGGVEREDLMGMMHGTVARPLSHVELLQRLSIYSSEDICDCPEEIE